MPDLIIMRGISGSGKSTRARILQTNTVLHGDPKIVVISRDDLRLALYNKDFGHPVDEGLITKMEYDLIESALYNGVSVISDNTHLTPQYIRQKIAIAGEIVGTVNVKLMEVDVPLSVAKNQNFERGDAGGRFVPEDVIVKQNEQFHQHRSVIHSLFDSADIIV